MIFYPVVLFGASSQDTSKQSYVMPSNQQDQLNRIEKDVATLKGEMNQTYIESYHRVNDSANRVITFVGFIATILGIILTLSGVYIGFESIRSRQRREEAIKTLEEAKSYVETKTQEFESTIKNKTDGLNKKYEDLIQLSLAQLTQDTEEAASRAIEKFKEREEKGITTEAERKVEYLEKRIKLFEEIGLPDDPKLLFSKAMICKEKKMFKESIELLEKAVRINTNYGDAFAEIGYIQIILKNYEDAVVAYDKFIQLNPNNANVYNNKGVALVQIGKRDQALDCYKKASELIPQNLLFLNNYAYTLSKLGMCDQALNVISKAIGLNPQEGSLYGTKASILKDLEKIDEAIRAINKSIEFNPSSLTSNATAIRLLIKAGKSEEALQLIKKRGELLKEVIKGPVADEGNWLDYFENLLIQGNYAKAKVVVSQIQPRINSAYYAPIFNFLSACLSFLLKDVICGEKQINIAVDAFEKSCPEVKINWNFEDLNPILKLNLSPQIYESCLVVENMFFKMISPIECKSKLDMFRAKRS